MSEETVSFACPHCKQHLEAPLDLAGQPVDCPKCHQTIEVPAPPVSQNAGDKGSAASVASAVSFSCRHCGKEMNAQPQSAGKLVRCSACGKTTVIPKPSSSPEPSTSGKTTENAPQGHTSRKSITVRYVVLGLVASVAIAACAVAITMAIAGKRLPRASSTPPQVLTNSTVRQTAADSPVSEGHEAVMRTGLLNMTMKGLTPTRVASYARQLERNALSRMDANGRDEDEAHVVFSDAYFLEVRSKEKTLVSAKVYSEYMWLVASNPRLIDVVRRTDSEIFTKEAVYEFDVCAYTCPLSVDLDKTGEAFKAVSAVCGGGPVGVVGVITDERAGALVKGELDALFHTAVIVPVREAFVKSVADESVKYGGERADKFRYEARIRFNAKDDKWVPLDPKRVSR